MQDAWWVFAWVGLYVVVMGVLVVGVGRLGWSNGNGSAVATVSVIVSARNEERDLPKCIAALRLLDYPADKLQIVLVDDFSTDATGKLIDAAGSYPNFVALHSSQLPDNGLEAKARGIAHGIRYATGEWLFITDADGTVEPQWIRAMLSGVTPQVGMVGGTLRIEGDGVVAKTEQTAWAFLQTFSAGLAGFGVPIICVGPNMAMRRSIYEAAGGLEGANFRVAEDLALFTMVRKAKFDVQMYMDAPTTVKISPVPSMSHLVSQHRRWLGGGVEQSKWYRVGLLLALWWGFGVMLFVFGGWALDLRAWAIFIGAKLFIDGATILQQQRRLGVTFRVPAFVVSLLRLEAYQMTAVAILPTVFLLSSRVEWRGEGYTVRYS